MVVTQDIFNIQHIQRGNRGHWPDDRSKMLQNLQIFHKLLNFILHDYYIWNHHGNAFKYSTSFGLAKGIEMYKEENVKTISHETKLAVC